MQIMLRFIALCMIFLSFDVLAFCFKEAGKKYNIDPLILYSIAVVESHLNPRAIGKNYTQDGSVIISSDYGLMQVNEAHIHKLKESGMIKNTQELLVNPCLNVQIGAWILSRHLNKCGFNWQCLGSYNAGFSNKKRKARIKYAQKVFRVYLYYRNNYS